MAQVNLSTSDMRVAIDIGSTVVKVAEFDGDDILARQQLYPRDFDCGIEKQIISLLGKYPAMSDVRICSSANGGLRVGVVCLTQLFSGSVFRNQVLSAGANPIYVHDFEKTDGDLRPVDVLLVGGGINCADAGPLRARLDHFSANKYRYNIIMYAGNADLASSFVEKYPDAVVIDNPLADELTGKRQSVSKVLREAYLLDLVYKEGVSGLGRLVRHAIRATPEVVSRGFRRVMSNRSSFEVSGPTILIDIGGATTDIHYTVEIIRRDSEVKPPTGSSIARYVFTDLGIVASRDTTLLQIRSHPRTFEFLGRVMPKEVRETYVSLREGEYNPSPTLMAYACLFLCLDRFTLGRGPGLPTADLDRVAQIILTGGGGQALDEDVVAGITRLFPSDERNDPLVIIDRDYRIWAEGMMLATNLSGFD
jgi:hypothetical protein